MILYFYPIKFYFKFPKIFRYIENNNKLTKYLSTPHWLDSHTTYTLFTGWTIYRYTWDLRRYLLPWSRYAGTSETKWSRPTQPLFSCCSTRTRCTKMGDSPSTISRSLLEVHKILVVSFEEICFKTGLVHNFLKKFPKALHQRTNPYWATQCNLKRRSKLIKTYIYVTVKYFLLQL